MLFSKLVKGGATPMRTQVKFTPCVLAAIISVLCVANAKASPITYTETATVSATLQTSPSLILIFTDDLLTVTGTGNTANITSAGSVFLNNVTTASFTISSGGIVSASGTFTDAFEVFDNQTSSPVPSAGFHDLANGQDILDTFNAAFASYALLTSIGPITGSSFKATGVSFPTSAGTLIITSPATSGTATFTAVVTPPSVPLPAALPLFATGLAGLGLLGWRRKKKAAP
jgi:hypothetical protein